MKERDIEQQVYLYAREAGWWSTKFVSPMRKFVPDRIFIKDGRVVFIEFKSSKGTLAQGQDHIIKEMKQYGAEVHVVSSVAQAAKILRFGKHAD